MKNLKHRLSELYVSIVITLLSISFWAVCVIYFRPLYTWSVDWFHIEDTSGFSKKQILENYNALIDYNQPWVKGKLSLPSLPQSPEAIQHFVEVKDIFNLLIACIPITAVLLIVYVFCTRKNHNLHYLKTASIMLVLAPFVLGSGFIIDFDKTFTLFHELFFDNDYWLFDPLSDPIISMLPANFFMLCGIVIIALQFLTSLCCYLIYRKTTQK